MTPGGKASEQPRRIPVSQDEIEAIMVCNIFQIAFIMKLNLTIFFKINALEILSV